MSKILCEFNSIDEADIVIGNIKRQCDAIDGAIIRENPDNSDDNTSLFIPFLSNTSALGSPNNGAVNESYFTPSPLGSYFQYQDDPQESETSLKQSVTAEIHCSPSDVELLISKLVNHGARSIRPIQ